MAREVRDYAGGAVDTTLAAGINSTDLSIQIADATGWPTGGANGPFFIVVSYDVTGKEKIEVASRTGTTLTVASTGKRGIDGTSAASHASGAKIRHCITAQDHDEFNSHAFDTGQDDHTQYLNTARHDTTGRHTVGSVVPAGTPGAIAPDDTAAAGVANSVARSDHRHAITAAAATSISGTNAEGVAATFARSDHDHDIVAGAIVGGDIASGAISPTKIATGLVLTYSQVADPGAVGANNIWFDVTNRQIKVRNAANSGWELYGEKITPWTDYVPTLAGVTLGTGGVRYGRYTKLGKTVVGIAGFRLGTGGSVTGSVTVSLPSTAAFTGANMVGNAEWLGGGRASDTSPAVRWAGIGRTTDGAPTTITQVATGGAVGWDNTYPFPWAVNDLAALFFMYEEV